jgi:hypothetical protein
MRGRCVSVSYTKLAGSASILEIQREYIHPTMLAFFVFPSVFLHFLEQPQKAFDAVKHWKTSILAPVAWHPE